ncbi:MAG TPA: hypothetical protein VF158_03855 [Longimicrobiales bacterium]
METPFDRVEPEPPGLGAEAVDVSVLVPVAERPEPLDGLYEEYAAALREAGLRFEFIFAVEPWRRDFVPALAPLRERGEPVRSVVVGQTVGESALLKAAAAAARGAIVVTLPAYRRVDASVLPGLIRRVEAGADVALAYRWPRRDGWLNRLQSGLFHGAVRRLVGERMRDIACGVRAMRRDVLRAIPLYGDFHRFLPLFARREGFTVEEVAAPQHAADARTRIYPPGVYLRRLIDLLNLFFLLRFTEKPLRFFGLVGSLLAFAGAVVLGILSVQRLGGKGIADRPLLLLGALLVVVGLQAVALGLVGEIIVHLHAPDRRPYRIADRVPGA